MLIDEVRDFTHAVTAAGDPRGVVVYFALLFDDASEGVGIFVASGITAFNDAGVAAKHGGGAGFIEDVCALRYELCFGTDAVVIGDSHHGKQLF